MLQTRREQHRKIEQRKANSPRVLVLVREVSVVACSLTESSGLPVNNRRWRMSDRVEEREIGWCWEVRCHGEIPDDLCESMEGLPTMVTAAEAGSARSQDPKTALEQG